MSPALAALHAEEAVCLLTQALAQGAVECPDQAYTTIGALERSAVEVQHILELIESALVRLQVQGQLVPDYRERPVEASMRRVRSGLAAAAHAADQLERGLAEAHCGLGGIASLATPAATE